MKKAEHWLIVFGRALAAHGLYGPGHQARKESSARLMSALEDLLRDDVRPTFTFLDDAVIYRTAPIHSLKDWSWARRLGAAGVRRLEFGSQATANAVEEFLDRVGCGLGTELQAAHAGGAEAPGPAPVLE